MSERERGNYTGKYEVLGDVELVGEEAVQAERQIAQADSESKLRQTHFASGFDAGRASAQAEIERLRTNIEDIEEARHQEQDTWVESQVYLGTTLNERDQYRRLYESYKTSGEELAAQLAATRAVVEAAGQVIAANEDDFGVTDDPTFDRFWSAVKDMKEALAALDAAEKATAGYTLKESERLPPPLDAIGQDT